MVTTRGDWAGLGVAGHTWAWRGMVWHGRHGTAVNFPGGTPNGIHSGPGPPAGGHQPGPVQLDAPEGRGPSGPGHRAGHGRQRGTVIPGPAGGLQAGPGGPEGSGPGLPESGAPTLPGDRPAYAGAGAGWVDPALGLGPPCGMS